MMNNHSKRFGMAVLAVALFASGCGGSDDEGGAANKADWEKEYGTVVSAVSDDIDRTNQALSGGQRTVLLSECTQLSEDLVEARKALPVPDAIVDAAFRDALNVTEEGAKQCMEGARVAAEAHLVELAQAKMKTAREKYTGAQDAIKNWQ